MTRWPYCLAEMGLYAVFAAVVLAMALDARDRWQKLRERADSAGIARALGPDPSPVLPYVAALSTGAGVQGLRILTDNSRDDDETRCG